MISQTSKRNKIMKARVLEKFIMMEFVKGNLDSQEQVNEINDNSNTKEIGYIGRECRRFFKKSGWIDLTTTICFLHIIGLCL